MALLRFCAGLLGVVGFALASGCADGPTSVLVTIDGPSSVTSVDLEVSLATGSRVSRTLPLGVDGKTLPGRVVIELPELVTQVTVRASALVDGAPRSDEKTVTSRLHRQITLSLQLGESQPDLSIDPSADLFGADFVGQPPLDFSGAPPSDLNGVATVEVAIGMYGGGGDHDDVGPDARFETNNALAVVGNIAYVAEYWSGNLRTIDLTTRAVSRLPLMRASDGAPTRLPTPTGAAYDGNGFLYLASYSSHTINKIELATGKVTRVVGLLDSAGAEDGDATVARFNNPAFLTFDASGDLWVADRGNNRLRKIALAGTPTVSTPSVANSLDMGAPPSFAALGGMRISGNTMYVADDGGVVKVDLSTTPLLATQFVGKNKLQNASDLELVGTDLYVSDSNLNNVWRFPLANPASGVFVAGGNTFAAQTLDGTATAARFQNPCCVVAVGTTTLYVAEPYTLRKLTLGTNVVETIAGRGANAGSTDTPPRLNRPDSIYYDGNDALYITDAGGNRVRKWTLSTKTLSTVAGSGDYDWADGQGIAADIYNPTGITGDAAGNLYVSDSGNSCIRKIDSAGNVTTIVGHPKVDGAAPATDNMNGADVYLGSPAGLAFDGNQTLYLADIGNDVVLSISLADSTYKTSVFAGDRTMAGHVDATGKAARFEGPRGIAYDGTHQRLYVTDINSDTLRRIDIATRAVTTISGITYNPFTSNIPAGDNGSLSGTRHNSPTAVLVLPGGDAVLVSNADGHTIQRLDLTGDKSSSPIGVAMEGFVRPGPLPARIQEPVGLAKVGSVLYFVSRNEHVVLTATGVLP